MNMIQFILYVCNSRVLTDPGSYIDILLRRNGNVKQTILSIFRAVNQNSHIESSVARLGFCLYRAAYCFNSDKVRIQILVNRLGIRSDFLHSGS